MVRGIYCARTGGRSSFIVLKAQMDVPGFGTPPKMKTDYAATQTEAEKKAADYIVKEGAVAVTFERISGMWTCAPEGRTWGPLEVLTGKRAPHPVER